MIVRGGKTVCDTVTNLTITLHSSVDPETRVLYPQTQLLSCVPTATSSVTTNTCYKSTDTAVYPGTHVVCLRTQHVSGVCLDSQSHI